MSVARAWPLVVLAMAASPARAQLAERLGDPAPARAREERAAAQREDAEPPRAERGGLGRRLGVPHVRASAPAEPPRAPERPWTGPQFQLGYAFYRVSDGYGGGDVHAGGIAVHLPIPVPELRLALDAELGARDYSLGGDDLLARGSVEIGARLVGLLDPFVPHAVAIATFGGIVAKRFETTVTDAFGGGGLGLGGELRLYRNLHAGFQIAYLRLEMDGAAYDVLQLRLFAGL
ncbi:MAG TPA: hypothetical protein VIL20_26815 [Sandaracinaceae bacterium]